MLLPAETEEDARRRWLVVAVFCATAPTGCLVSLRDAARCAAQGTSTPRHHWVGQAAGSDLRPVWRADECRRWEPPIFCAGEIEVWRCVEINNENEDDDQAIPPQIEDRRV